MAWNEHFQVATWLRACGGVVGAYLLGCFATGYYLVRARTGRDIRQIASGSVGARNVGRVLGKSGFLLTVLGDLTKGAVAVWGGRAWAGGDRLAALAMLAVVAGHLWPAQLHFHGGKGVATSLGALLILDYRLALTFAVVFLIGYLLAHKSLFPALLAFAALPLAGGWWGHDGVTVTLLAILATMIWLAHWKNVTDEMTALMARRAVTPKPQRPGL